MTGSSLQVVCFTFCIAIWFCFVCVTAGQSTQRLWVWKSSYNDPQRTFFLLSVIQRLCFQSNVKSSVSLWDCHDGFPASDFHAGKSKTCNFLVCFILLDVRMTSFVSVFCWRPSAADSLRQFGGTISVQALSIMDLWESASPPHHNHTPSVCLLLPSVISHTVTLVLLLQMWTNVRPTPTVVGPASSVWTQWDHLYASCRSLVLQATSWGTVFVRVSSLFLMNFIKPIYPAVTCRATKVVCGNADDVLLCRIVTFYLMVREQK